MKDFSQVSIEQLNLQHPEREFWLWIYFNYRMLYRGGEEFLRAAGQQTTTRASAAVTQTSPVIDAMSGRNRRRRFLYQLEGEPDTKYISRWERAFYIGYAPAMLDYFVTNLFVSSPVIRPCDGKQAPKWFASFWDNCDGSGTKFLDFIKSVFRDTMTVRRAGWLIGRADNSIGTVADDAGPDNDSPVVLTPYSAEDIMDWQEDDTGELDWMLVRKERRVREFPDDRKRVEIRTYVDRNEWAAWQINKVDSGEAVKFLDQGAHGLGSVPFVRLDVPFGLWAMNKLAGWQISIFNQMSMLDSAQLLSCFLQPVLTTPTPGETNHVFSDGTLLTLRGGDKERDAEKFEWVAPDSTPLAFSAKQIADLRDEGYRIVHMMSQAVDSSATNTIARSGVSKVEDRRAAEIILQEYGSRIRDVVIQTLNKISTIVGDNLKWTCDGFDNFQVSSLEEELQNAALMSTFDIKSPTFKKRLQTQIATGSRILNHIDEETKDQIRDEIEESIDAETEAEMAPQMTPVPPPTQVGPPQPAKNGMPPQPPKQQPPMPPGKAQPQGA